MKYPDEIDFKKIPRLGKDEVYLAIGLSKCDYVLDDGTTVGDSTEIREYESKPDLRKGFTEYIPSHCGYKYDIYIAKKVLT